MVKLVEPHKRYEKEYRTFYEEWILSSEKIVPWTAAENPAAFDAFVNWLNHQEEETEMVPHSTFWLVEESGKITGAVNIRHSLNESLKIRGGHIGYGVLPSERRKGYATKMLSLALEKAGELGIKEVLVTCDADNKASQKTILRNGGILHSEEEINGVWIKRFWIQLQS
ncbi:GNAT family N-acetyltransferase [Bacillus mangrovi]|uniref:GNAT family N-acetyltransferase n=1 Tax=Metabacillus mangrovi TaxID=1491830 RepID=A0A7X2S665_9BACI|nr:GNAT family N-acetyltransferase [Metabacillus mangrovi]MTH54393.1 GNAT family N-acetyltransferase [Metabacillus mangrovi]